MELSLSHSSIGERLCVYDLCKRLPAGSDEIRCGRESSVTRRDFLCNAASGLVTTCLTAATRESPLRGAAAASDRPNIVFAIADDWSFPHAGAYGDSVVKTPVFDRLARDGVLFNNAYCAAPTCTPSRGAILTGQPIHRLEEGGNLWSQLPSAHPPQLPDACLLKKALHHIPVSD